MTEGWQGRFFEDFKIGDVYQHPIGRTVTATDNIWSGRAGENRFRWVRRDDGGNVIDESNVITVQLIPQDDD